MVSEEDQVAATKTVLVTGASGYLGGRICHALVNQARFQVKAFVRSSSSLHVLPTGVELVYGDLNDYQSLVLAFNGCNFILHCGALVSPWLPDPSKFITVNVHGLKNVIKAVRETSTVERLVYVSSVFALGPSNGQVVDETQVHPGVSYCTEYEKSKFIADRIALEEAKSGLPIVLVYPGFIYGPGKVTAGNSLVPLDRREDIWEILWLAEMYSERVSPILQAAQMMGNDAVRLIHLLTEQLKLDKEKYLEDVKRHKWVYSTDNPCFHIEEMWADPTPTVSVAAELVERCSGRFPGHIGPGKDIFSFCHVDDVALGCIAAIEKGKEGERYLLTGENVSFDKLLDIVDGLRGKKPSPSWFQIPLWVLDMIGWISVFWAKLTGYSPLISYPMVNVFKKQWAYSHEKAKQELGYQSRSLGQGIAELLSWLEISGLIKKQ